MEAGANQPRWTCLGAGDGSMRCVIGVAPAASVIADDWRVGPQWSSDWMHRVSFSRM